MLKKILTISFIIIGFNLVSLAQCPLCKSSVESAMHDEKNTTGKGLNSGILYLLATPYLAVAILGGVYFYNRKKKKQILDPNS